MTDQKGCYRCGRSLVFYTGRKFACVTCGKRFCDPCMNAYRAEQRTNCPGCGSPLSTFKVIEPPRREQSEGADSGN